MKLFGNFREGFGVGGFIPLLYTLVYLLAEYTRGVWWCAAIRQAGRRAGGRDCRQHLVFVDGARRCRTRISKGDFGTLKYG